MRESRFGLLTVRELAERLGETKSRVHYALRRPGRLILPTARASQTLLYSRDVLPTLRLILRELDGKPTSGRRLPACEIENGGAR